VKLPETILADNKYHVLNEFASIYGVGPAKANILYSEGLRTLEDLKRYYKVSPDLKATTRQKQDKYVTAENWLEVSVELKDDLSIKMSRKEVEQMYEVVIKELNVVQPGCSHMIVGGYRRGKTESNDVDIIITHPDANKVKGLCRKLTQTLCDKGMLPISHE